MHAIARKLALAVFFVALPSAAVAAGVTYQRLVDAAAEPQNWLMTLGDYAGNRYSRLDQIDRNNVTHLVRRYSVVLGGLMDAAGNYAAALPVSPLVDDGFMYIVDGWGAVDKLDLRNEGAVVWRSEAGQHNLDSWLEAGRGIALYDNWVLSISADGKLRWIDRDTGAVTRTVQVGDPMSGYTISAPPLAANGVVIVAGSGAHRGASGRLDAFDVATGERRWQVAAAPDDWEGGAVMQAGIYDPDSGIAYFGAVRSLLAVEEREPGEVRHDNLLAVDVATGRIQWHYDFAQANNQQRHEAASYQLIGSPGTQLSIVHFGDDASLYRLPASDAAPPQRTSLLEGDAPWTGLPVSSTPATWLPEEAAGCPNIRSEPAFVASYSQHAGLAYGAVANACISDGRPILTPTNSGWLGAYYAGADSAMGALSAVDPVTGTVVARRLLQFPLHAGALATAGGLVFTTTAEGTLHALNDETLEPLWSAELAALTPVPPITFAVDGEQFVAVVVGGNRFSDELSFRPPGAGISKDLFVVVVYGLPS